MPKREPLNIGPGDYECPECGDAFARLDMANNHMGVAHGYPDPTPTDGEAGLDRIDKLFEEICSSFYWEGADPAQVRRDDFPKWKAAITALLVEARKDSKLQQAVNASGNEFAMGYDDSGCFWRFYAGARGAGSMIGTPEFTSESAEPLEALDEYLCHLQQLTQEGRRP